MCPLCQLIAINYTRGVSLLTGGEDLLTGIYLVAVRLTSYRPRQRFHRDSKRPKTTLMEFTEKSYARLRLGGAKDLADQRELQKQSPVGG